MSREDGWSAGWIANKLTEQKEVVRVDTISGNLIQVHRATDIVLVGTLGVQDVRLDDVKWALALQPGIKFVANVSGKARFSGNAIIHAKAHGAALGGFGDLRRALTLASPSSYVDRETSFREKALAQHDRVKSFTRLDDNRYLIVRNGHPDVTVVFLYDYELSADAVRTAMAEYGPFQAVIKMDPNGGVSAHARDVASHAGRRILKWGEFLGELNRKWT